MYSSTVNVAVAMGPGWSPPPALRGCYGLLLGYFPGVRDSVRWTHCVRWPEAEPYSPPGRSRAVAEYRRGLGRERRVVLAGH